MSHEDREDQTDDLLESRNNAMKRARKAASNGDAICKGMLDLEQLASPFYLGQDVDPDDSDLIQ